jgi:hypothetical protein
LDQQGENVIWIFIKKRFCFIFSGGKTVVLSTLAEAQTQMGIKTILYTVNPKAMSVIELYGTLDPLTRKYLRWFSYPN